MQNYYCIATHVNHDCASLNRTIMTLLTNRLSTRTGNRLVKKGRELTAFEKARFGKSKMIRYVAGTNEPIYPIGYTQHKNPLFRKKSWNYYTPEGREGIHDCLRINVSMMLALMRMPTYSNSAEYADNRISLFSAQWGKCAVHDLLRPLSQDDIDDALRAWNGNIESKHAVVRYMQQHGREKETAAWLAHEYGGKEGNNLFIVRAGSPETAELSWAKVQRRIAQLIREDNFFTEQERDNFDDIDPAAIRETLAQRGIVGGKVVDSEKLNSDPFIQRVMQDTERVAEQEEPTIDPADRFHVVSLDRGFRTLYAVWDDEAHGYYVDADGVTEEFTSEWQAEAYRLELQGQAEQALMERAKGLISDFCRSEYGSEADFSDPAKIGVAYTTVTDDEIPIQVNIDLVNYRLERYLDDEHLETRQYGSLQELMTNELENLDFSDLIHVSDEDVEQYRWHETEAPAVEHPEAVESVPVPQKDKFPYSVGDTVYLEDGKPFIIESIGLFDISLRDPSLRYPVSRAESRESFARLMERYPQPEQAPAYTEQTVAVYPADQNNLPYDVEICTLRFDEPEHDPPSAEPAKPEPPAMSEEEALTLEQEGRAAL